MHTGIQAQQRCKALQLMFKHGCHIEGFPAVWKNHQRDMVCKHPGTSHKKQLGTHLHNLDSIPQRKSGYGAHIFVLSTWGPREPKRSALRNDM